MVCGECSFEAGTGWRSHAVSFEIDVVEEIWGVGVRVIIWWFRRVAVLTLTARWTRGSCSSTFPCWRRRGCGFTIESCAFSPRARAPSHYGPLAGQIRLAVTAMNFVVGLPRLLRASTSWFVQWVQGMFLVWALRHPLGKIILGMVDPRVWYLDVVCLVLDQHFAQ